MAHSSKDVLEEGELQGSNELFGVMGMEGQTAGLVEQFVDNLGDPDGTLDEFFDMKKVQTCHEDDTAFLVPADDDDRGAGWTVDNLLELNGFVPSDRERGREERRRKVVNRRELDREEEECNQYRNEMLTEKKRTEKGKLENEKQIRETEHDIDQLK